MTVLRIYTGTGEREIGIEIELNYTNLDITNNDERSIYNIYNI